MAGGIAVFNWTEIYGAPKGTWCFCILSQKFCVPPGNFVLARKTFAFIRKVSLGNANFCCCCCFFPSSPCPFRGSAEVCVVQVQSSIVLIKTVKFKCICLVIYLLSTFIEVDNCKPNRHGLKATELQL